MSKETLLFDTLREHLRDLLDAVAAIGDRKLPALQQKTLTDMERALVAIFPQAIAALDPGIGCRTLLKPVTMSLFGMLNWHCTWFRNMAR